MTMKRGLLGLAVATGTLSGIAQAQTTTPDCNDPTLFPNPVYLTGSSAVEPMLAKFSVAIQNANAGKSASDWVVMARESDDLGGLASDPRWVVPVSATAPLWTDDFSNILSALMTR